MSASVYIFVLKKMLLLTTQLLFFPIEFISTV